MAKKLKLEYDLIGDILYVETCAPYLEQESDELGDEMVGRYNPKTGELESIEILFFSKRFRRGVPGKGITLPFTAKGPKADPPSVPVRPAGPRGRRRAAARRS